MSADALTVAAAILVPLLTVAALIRFIARLGELEGSRDELIRLRDPRG